MKTRTPRQPNGKIFCHRVHFELVAPQAQSVCIAGTFNDWHPQTAPMITVGEGRWAKDLMLLPGSYEYRFVVDGAWITDPRAQEIVSNTFGTTNALLKIPEKGQAL